MSGRNDMVERMTTGPARATKLAGQRYANAIVRAVLRTPLLCRLLGRRLIVMYVVGRKSGRCFAVPVAYERDGQSLLVGTPFAWGRNLRTGEPVEIRFLGRRRTASVQVVTDEAGVTKAYAMMARANQSFAKFNRIGLDASGTPDR